MAQEKAGPPGLAVGGILPASGWSGSGLSAPPALEFCALDVWMDPAGMGQLYSDPNFPAALGQLFAGRPSQSAWRHPAGEWVEW